MAAHVTEYQGHFRTCRGCGALNHAAIPADLKGHSIGPRLAATPAYLTGSHRVGKRGLEEITEDVFDVPLSLGTVANPEQEMSAALTSAHVEALQAVREADVKNVDETSWKLAGKLCWLRLAATSTIAAFLIHAHRVWDALTALLGEEVKGFVCSDRWSAYGRLSPWRRQVCWAHLKRDFQELMDRGGPAAQLGEVELQRVAGRIRRGVAPSWRASTGARYHARAGSTRIRSCSGGSARTRHDLSVCSRPVSPKVLPERPWRTVFCENLLESLPAVWRFVVSEGSSRRTTTPSVFCAVVCCGGRTRSAATARAAAASWNGC